MEPAKKLDYVLLGVVIVLLVLGSIMLMSSSSVVGFANFNDPYYYFKKHAAYLILGCFTFSLGLAVPHQTYKNMVIPGLGVATFLLLLTLIPGVGVQLGGAKRWLNLGFFQMQPVEVAKFFIIVFVATSLSNKQQLLQSFTKGIIPILMVVGIPLALLIKQPDLGNVILSLIITFTLLFLGGARAKHLLGMIGSGVFVVICSVATHPYQLGRVKTFLFPWRDPLGKSYHIVQSFIAIGSGGFWGLGIGQSKIKYFYLPLQYSDFIFSIVCEEGGFILGTAVIILYGILFYRGVSIAYYASSLFSYYLGIGLTLLLIFQAVINMGVAIGMFPVKGVPLTFISFGGTSLIMSMFYVGVLLNISKTPAPKDFPVEMDSSLDTLTFSS